MKILSMTMLAMLALGCDPELLGLFEECVSNNQPAAAQSSPDDIVGVVLVVPGALALVDLDAETLQPIGAPVELESLDTTLPEVVTQVELRGACFRRNGEIDEFWGGDWVSFLRAEVPEWEIPVTRSMRRALWNGACYFELAGMNADGRVQWLGHLPRLNREDDSIFDSYQALTGLVVTATFGTGEEELWDLFPRFVETEPDENGYAPPPQPFYNIFVPQDDPQPANNDFRP